jgi:hypothetical protein
MEHVRIVTLIIVQMRIKEIASRIHVRFGKYIKKMEPAWMTQMLKSEKYY